MATPESSPLEVLLVTGPLGAGKTTVVNRLLKAEIAAGRRVAVLINEFGSVSVDEALVNAERPELAGIENLVNGCACCSLRDEVVAVLAAWCNQDSPDRPERVVLETTGLADPTDLVDLEGEALLAGRIRLVGCLTVVSALGSLTHLESRTLLRHQVGLASLIHVSKADLDPSLAMAWESELRSRFPGRPIVQTRLGQAPPGAPDPWRGDIPKATEATVGPSFSQARALAVHFDHPVDPAALEALLQSPPPVGELLRAKGVCSFVDFPPRNDGSDRWAFQMADGRVEIAPLPAGEAGQLPQRVAVIIGTQLDWKHWRKSLQNLERPAPGARRKVTL